MDLPKITSQHWLFKAGKPMQEDSIGHLMASQKIYGDIYDLNIPGRRLISLHHPDYVKHLLVTENKRYRKDRATRMLSLALGNGLLTSEGEFWRRQRRIAQPAFHKERLSKMVTTMVDATHQMLDRWEEGTETVDLSQEMMVLASDIAARALFGAEISDNLKFGEALLTGMHFITQRFKSLMPTPMWVPTQKNLRFKKANAVLNETIRSMIEGRRHETAPRHDLLAMLMEARDADTGEGMSDEQLRDEVITLFSAGHETSANGLTWLFYLLDRHPEIVEKLDHEISSVLNGKPPTVADLPRLEYTMRVIQESLRLYPPAWAIGREAMGPDEIAGYPIKKGDTLIICIYALHRREDQWPDPEKFDPNRFLPEVAKNRHRYAYLPFGGGPRFCIGSHFALMEMQVAVAMILQRYRLSLEPGQSVELQPLITLRPKDGMRMRIMPALS